jgi:hypothetical protein
MTFAAYEIARFLGRKVALYSFTIGSTEWLYTSADRPVTRASKTYLRADGIQHSAVRDSGSSAAKNQVTVTMPYRLNQSAAELPVTQALGNVFWPHAPTGRVLVTISTTHLNDPDAEVAVDHGHCFSEPNKLGLGKHATDLETIGGGFLLLPLLQLVIPGVIARDRLERVGRDIVQVSADHPSQEAAVAA